MLIKVLDHIQRAAIDGLVCVDIRLWREIDFCCFTHYPEERPLSTGEKNKLIQKLKDLGYGATFSDVFGNKLYVNW
jgi:hypothetical protein